MSTNFENDLRRLCKAIFFLVCGVLLVALVLITFGDVTGRKIGYPFPIGYELTQLLMAIVVFLAMTYITATREHITVDVFKLSGSSRARKIWVAGLELVMGISLVFFAFTLWEEAQSLMNMNSLTMVSRVPIGYNAYFGAICMGVAGLISLWQAWRHLGATRTETD